ncbi:hypothetical protein E4S40_01720 [Algoriphagus kandeliae]|uniref:Nucleotidyl transferase AbiEii/AbiGii toxin family protein n=1 Tax=Algoriphagus kandeliae TaxID=2562278 RepID=A0A4Y9QZ96_9BACT|nr:nucleotidyl transferase AbiEii/AbiGii toxin family protein [Algoriphagus kandeliae]TFV97400.1 hypothetical protein E4S40_01720 [Algoriphagus kandeliae]
MLHKETVNSRLLEILTALMNHPYFDEFCLVGGTSLALQIGHRESVDIDLFGMKELDELMISEFLDQLGESRVLKKSKNILIYTVDNIKIDFVNYRYLWLNPCLLSENLRLADKRDIAAMKLNAISGRGSKKDFIDLYFLMNEYSLAEMLGFFRQKYNDGSEFLVLKSLTYFHDADLDESPKMIAPIDWNEIKRTIAKKVKDYFETI